MTISKIINYKRNKRAMLREQVRKYGHTADALECAGMHEMAKMYRNIAIIFQRQAEEVRESKLNSYQMYRRDKKNEFAYARAYADAVELFR